MTGHAADVRRRPTRPGDPVLSVSDGCPVKLEMVSISSRSDGTSSRSTSPMIRAISEAKRCRSRSACTKSTAERKRDIRKKLGQASGTCAFSSSSRLLSVSSSNDAAASAKRIGIRLL